MEGVEMTELSDLRECKTCGAVVKSTARHAQWHAEVTQIGQLAASALETAESAEITADQAANVLYQNDITL